MIRGIAQILMIPSLGLIYLLSYVTIGFYQSVYYEGHPAKYIQDWKLILYLTTALLAMFPPLILLRTNKIIVRLASAIYLVVISTCLVTLIYMYLRGELDFDGIFSFLNRN
jgi:O-antigen ligase